MGLTRRDVLLGALCGPTLWSGCTGTGAPSRFGRFRPREGQELRFNIFAEPEYLDPALLTGHPDAFVAMQLFEGLVEPDPRTLAPRPAVARSWSVSPDGLSLSFQLRRDAQWSDGEPVTAHDFVYAWERALRPSTASRYAYHLYPVRHARLYSQGRIKRIVRSQVRPRRPPFVEFGGDRRALAPTLDAFPEDSVVELLGSNLRVAVDRQSLELLAEPRRGALPVSELAAGAVGVVLARQLVGSAAEDEPGAPSPDSWVQLRPPSGGRAAWVQERLVRPAFPSTDLRLLEGERGQDQRRPLRDAPKETAAVLGFGADEDEVEVVDRQGEWTRVLHLGSGRVGWVFDDALDDAAGDRNWFYVEVKDTDLEGPPQEAGSARRGWVPGRELSADASVLGVRARSDHELDVHLETPTPYFLSLASRPVLMPVPRHVVERYGRGWTRPDTIVTNGAFLLDEHIPRDRIELVRSNTYHGARAVELERAVIYSIEDEHTSVNMYRAGFLDASLSAKLPVELVPRLVGAVDYVTAPYLATYFLKLNVTKAPLDDLRVRRALNLAIDKQLLCERLLRGGQTPATHVVPPGLPGYPVVDGEACDVDRARALFAEAGFPAGEGFPRLEYLYNTSEHHRVVAEYLQRQWQDALGIEVVLVNQEWKTYLKRLHSLDYEITRSGWIGDYTDPNTFLDLFVTGGGNNETGFSDLEYDRIVEEAARLADPMRRLMRLARAEGVLNRELPILPLYYYVNNFLCAPEVEGYHANLLDLHALKGVRIRPPVEGGS